MAKEEVPVEIRTYEEARNILRNFTTNGAWLKNLVWKYSVQYSGRTVQERWPFEYKDLIKYGNKIKGVAQKILKSSPQCKDLVGMIEAEKGLEGDALIVAQERTSMRLDGADNSTLKDLSLVYNKEVLGGYYRG